jgi:UDP-N-acetylglucosamine--N-acetylmuramyl-(pentapeptide) pyrophosphoryl-undecaprenol N-acetylglucosamine transferase
MRGTHKFLILAAGTGGHIMPALSVADYLIKLGHTVHWIGTGNAIEKSILSSHSDIKFYSFKAKGFRGKGFLQKIYALLMMVVVAVKSYFLIKRIRPDVVLGMGGYISLPGGLAAWVAGVPLVIHEQNSIPGSANKLLIRFAKQACQGLPGPANRAFAKQVGNPIRDELLDHFIDRACLDKAPDKKDVFKILVLGGSQGASYLNANVPRALNLIKGEKKIHLIHQAGKGKLKEVDYQNITCIEDVVISEFITDIVSAYKWADLIICRSGALTVSEVMATGGLAIFIPYPHAIDEHQYFNALTLSDKGGAFLLSESEGFDDELSRCISSLVNNAEIGEQMKKIAKESFIPHAKEAIGKLCIEQIKYYG